MLFSCFFRYSIIKVFFILFLFYYFLQKNLPFTQEHKHNFSLISLSVVLFSDRSRIQTSQLKYPKPFVNKHLMNVINISQMRVVPVVTHHSDADEGTATYSNRDEQGQPVRGKECLWKQTNKQKTGSLHIHYQVL